MNRKVRYVNRIFGEALALYRDDVVVCRLYNGDNIKVYTCRKHLAVIVVGVVASYFCTAGCGKITKLLAVAEDAPEFLRRFFISFSLRRYSTFRINLLKGVNCLFCHDRFLSFCFICFIFSPVGSLILFRIEHSVLG